MIKYPINVTIDTNVFDENKYDLAEGSTLSLLTRYVQKQKIKIVISNIVINEISRHVQDKAYEIAAMVNNLRKDTRKKYSESIIRCVGMEQILNKPDREDMACKAKVDLETFLEKLNVEVLDSSNVDVEKIFKDYFNFCPPFEKSDKKRKEFPDAFIVEEIKERFKDGEQVAIISKDDGFKKACGNLPNFLFFNSLGELYNTLNKQEQYYDKAVDYVSRYNLLISQKIKEYIVENDCVDVVGISYDKDGVSEGYDYSETLLEAVESVSCGIHTIDEISDEQVYATLVCKADIDVDCYYEDYDNAAWDSESKTFLYLETKQIKESHSVRFCVKVNLDLQSEEFQLAKFTIILGGDSLKERTEIVDDEIWDYEQEIIDMDRENVGLTAMNSYEDFLEENLADSKMKQEIIGKFEEINSLKSKFEEICILYDEIIERLKSAPIETKELIVENAKKTKEMDYLLVEMERTEAEETDVEEVIAWLEERYNEVSKILEAKALPDDIEFGRPINFFDANQNHYTLIIDSIDINPSEGEEEYIDIRLSNDSNKEVYKGYIKLTVGYLNYDDDGGIADGLDDDVDYYYEDILKEISHVIEGLNELYNKHDKLSQTLQGLS